MIKSQTNIPNQQWTVSCLQKIKKKHTTNRIPIGYLKYSWCFKNPTDQPHLRCFQKTRPKIMGKNYQPQLVFTARRWQDVKVHLREASGIRFWDGCGGKESVVTGSVKIWLRVDFDTEVIYQVIQPPWPFYPQTLEVTSNHWKGSRFTIPKKVAKNCQVGDGFTYLFIVARIPGDMIQFDSYF